jgi:hypothetical protein
MGSNHGGGSRNNVFKADGIWALGADELQWILCRAKTTKEGPIWQAITFVSTTKKILAERMKEKGVEPGSRQKLLEGLPDTFSEWKTHRRAS